MRPIARSTLAALFLLATLLAGLAPAEEKGARKTGSIQGKVTFQGKPLSGGTVALHPEKGKALSGAIAADGSYSVDRVPIGRARVTVASKFVLIPPKYADVKTSGLTYKVVAGKQVSDIVLSP